MAGEFELIKKKLSGHDHGPGVILGIGDDCALLQPQKGRQLAVTTDTMVEGRHFFAGTRADYLGWRALAVNLSDLAAMGARPVWFLLSLNLPDGNKQWVADFARGLFALADREKIPLIGGNMSAGPLSITITAAGAIKPERAMLRSAARPGDGIYVTGSAARKVTNLVITNNFLAENNTGNHKFVRDIWADGLDHALIRGNFSAGSAAPNGLSPVQGSAGCTANAAR